MVDKEVNELLTVAHVHNSTTTIPGLYNSLVPVAQGTRLLLTIKNKLVGMTTNRLGIIINNNNLSTNNNAYT